MFSLDSPRNLVYGLLVGIAFGFLLQRGTLSRYRVILSQLLLARHVMLRVMLTAIVVGSAGIWFMHEQWNVSLHVKSAALLANIAGGVIFGLGMATLGYCPGTAVAAIGEGSRHAIAGALGMLAGAAIYAEAYGWVKDHVLGVWAFGEVTLADQTGLSPWVFVAATAVIAAVVMLLLKGRDLPER